MTKGEQQVRATLNDHIVIHKVTDYIFAKRRDGTEIYAVDVIKKPLVRCKDCRYKDMEICPMYRLVVAGVRKYDDFCSYGERKGE